MATTQEKLELLTRAQQGDKAACARLVEENAGISGILDATPFLVYFIENVYHKLSGALPAVQTTAAFQAALSQGQITEKEKSLWKFVLPAYGDAEFSPPAVGKRFRKRRLRDDPQLCPEIREAGTAPICAVREPREVCGSYELRKQRCWHLSAPLLLSIKAIIVGKHL